MSTMYEYYEGQPFLPTFADFRDAAALQRYAQLRHDVCAVKLYLPIRLFSGSRLLQFGPDSGEDALVFASDGARLTLVEPNPKAHATIRRYFGDFGLEESLESLVASDVLGFASAEQYDFIDAEGFIYTVQPTSAWLDAFNRLLKPGGMFLITYYERLGAVVELCLKSLFAFAKRLDADGPTAVAERLYRKKWDAIPHTRAFESWVMDVMENPFVRARYFLDANGLCDLAAERNFDLYSAWPSYRDSLAVYWHKQHVSRERRRELDRAHLSRSALSFMTGYKLYLTDDATTRLVHEAVNVLIFDIDRSIDESEPIVAARCSDGFRRLASEVSSANVLCDRSSDRDRAVALLLSLSDAFSAAERGDVKTLYAITNENEAFVESWGMPNHLAVFSKVR